MKQNKEDSKSQGVSHIVKLGLFHKTLDFVTDL